MAEEVVISVYGGIIDPEWQERRNRMLYEYLEAVIKAENLNPDSDYEGDRKYELLKKIAQSELECPKRNSLIQLLEQE